MEEKKFFLRRSVRKFMWASSIASSIIVLLMPIYFFHLEKELKFFKRSAWSYKRFIESTYNNPKAVLNFMPRELHNVPFGEKTGVVLGSKKIAIRGIPNPYNASIIEREGGGYLLFFRYDVVDEKAHGYLASYIGCTEMDSNFEQTAKEYVTIDTGSHYSEDARVFKSQGKLYLVFNDLVQDPPGDCRIMCMGELDLKHARLKSVAKYDPHFQSVEKNWVPFEYIDQNKERHVYFEYNITPHKLLKVSDPQLSTIVHLPFPHKAALQGLCWPSIWGPLRGGTPAKKIDDQYLAFFHSSFQDEHHMRWYCLGAYTFEDHPPFRVTAISYYPLLFEGIFNSPPMNTADPLKRVIFPGGFVIEKKGDKELIHVSCGENDSSVKVITLDKEVLLKGLKKIVLNSPFNVGG